MAVNYITTSNERNVGGKALNDGVSLGDGILSKVSLYGVTPVIQRAATAQGTTIVGTASSTDITTGVKAAIIEIMDTLAAVGIWKGLA
jgi:hypothetical protein